MPSLFLSSFLQLKMWISFLIPKIEDGNNFGVSIQEETLGEIRTVESEAASFFDQISRYYMTRAKLVSKVGNTCFGPVAVFSQPQELVAEFSIARI